MKDLAGCLAMLKTYEGNFPYMYLDSRGYVTVGVGFLLSTAADATNYTFYLNPAPPAPPPVQRPGTPPPRPVPVPSGPQKATDAQIKAEWTNINGQAKNHLATFYQRFTTMKMQQSDIDFALTQKINTFEGKARQTFANWDDFPACAQLALLDMIYNLGSLSAFPSLVKFATAKDWKNAAAQCHRDGPSDQRNNDTNDRFLAAAKEQPLPPVVAQAVAPAAKK